MCKIYFIHSRIIWFHSLNNPRVNSSSKRVSKATLVNGVTMFMLIKYGNRIISSTSKIIKTNATKKKWSLNFNRKSLYVLKPHSKGL